MGILPFFLLTLLVSPSLADIPCGKGKYQIRQGSSCITCPAGYYCLPTDPAKSLNECPPFTFNPTLGGGNSSVCQNCTSNFISYSGADRCGCPAGSYNSSSLPYECLPCPAGSYCPYYTTNPIKCPMGTYNPTTGSNSTSSCLLCPAGYFGSSRGLSNASCNGLCQAGYFCPSGSSNAAAFPCPLGYYCPIGTGTATLYPCPAGVYGSSTSLTNSSCSGPCPAGSYSPVGAAECSPCPAGKANPTAGAALCASCAQNLFSADGATSCSTTCSTGYVDPLVPSLCVSTCSKGYVPSQVNGGGQCVACPPGRTTTSTNLECAPCPAGRFSPDGAPCQQCSNGTTSYGGASACTPCASTSVSSPAYPGFCCPLGSVVIITARIYDIITNSLKSTLSCGMCPSGYACPAVQGLSLGQGGLFLEVPPSGGLPEYGFFPKDLLCPVGKYSPPGSTSFSSCTLTCSNPGENLVLLDFSAAVCLSPVSFSPSPTPSMTPTSSITPSASSNGLSVISATPSQTSVYYFGGGGASSSTSSKCSAFQNSPGVPPFNSKAPLLDTTTCCNSGYSTVLFDGSYSYTSNCQPCPRNYFSNSASFGQCWSCPMAQFSAQSGSSLCTSCPRGKFFFNSRQVSDCQSCASQAGFGCLEAGCYSFPLGSSTQGFPQGWSCITGSIGSPASSGTPAYGGFPCPLGYFCAGGTGVPPVACPPGKYNDQYSSTSVSACKSCPVSGMSSPPASNSSTSCYVCPIGTQVFADVTTSPPSSICRPCDSGYTTTSPGSLTCVPTSSSSSPWQQAQSILIPTISIIGAIVTYLAVGDRVFAACAPQTHARIWRGLASTLAHTLAPCLRRSCCRKSWGDSSAGFVEGAAGGILKRLADDAENKRKTTLAQKALTGAAPVGESGGDAGGGGEGGSKEGGSGSSSSSSRSNAVVSIENPLAGSSGVGMESPTSTWLKHSDGHDTWYSNARNSTEVVWSLPPGGVIVPAAAATLKASSSRKMGGGGVTWRRYSDEESVWYVSSAGDTAWELPEGAVLVDIEGRGGGEGGGGAVGAATTPPPQGWVCKTSKSSGQIYYFHKATGRTSWEFPTG